MRRQSMKRSVVVLVSAVLVAGVWSATPTAAEAGELSISLGVGFVVGGAGFRVAYATGGYLPFYYRVDGPLHHAGYGCSDHCYARGRHVFHAPFCPLVQFHFNHHRYDHSHHRRHSAWYGDRYRTRDYHRGAYYGHGRGRGWAHGHYRDGSRHYRKHRRYDGHSRGRELRGRHGRRSDDHRHRQWDDRRNGKRQRHESRSRAPGSAGRTRPRHQ